jgi:chromosome condensin MukBEF ATPase and DNA-binding subunit MukB
MHHTQQQGGTAMNEDLETEVRQLRRRIHELETKIGWYKAVNAQLRDDLIEANADFQALARTPAPTFDPLDAIVLGLRRENDARKHH